MSGVSTTWTVDGIRVDGLLSSLPPRQPGGEWTAELLFASAGAPTAAEDRYLNVREYLEFADRVDYGRTQTGEPWYRERLPAGAPIASLAVPISPQTVDDAGVFEGVWALVIGGSDPTRRGAEPFRLDVETVVLADRADYTDRAALEAELESSGL